MYTNEVNDTAREARLRRLAISQGRGCSSPAAGVVNSGMART